MDPKVLGSKFFYPKFLQTQNFFGPKLFLSINIFDPNIYDQIFSGLEISWTLKVFWTQNFFEIEIFLDLTLFGLKIHLRLEFDSGIGLTSVGLSRS